MVKFEVTFLTHTVLSLMITGEEGILWTILFFSKVKTLVMVTLMSVRNTDGFHIHIPFYGICTVQWETFDPLNFRPVKLSALIR